MELTRRGAGIFGDKNFFKEKIPQPEVAFGAKIPKIPSKTAHLEVEFLRRFLEDSSKMPEDNLR